MTDPFLGETLMNIATRVEQLLSLQKQMERNVSGLMASQASTQSTVVDIRKSLRNTQKPGDDEGGTPRLLSENSSRESLDMIEPPRSILKFPSSRTGSTGYLSERTAMNRHDTVDSQWGGHKADRAACRVSAEGGAMVPNCTSGYLRRGNLQNVRLLEEFAITTTADEDGSPGPSELTEDDLDARVDSILGLGLSSLGSSNRSSYRRFDGQRYTLDPHCKFRVMHDFLSIMVLFLDVVSAPVILAWELEVEGKLFMLSMISLAFWSLDIIMSFSTGYYNAQGELESKLSEVAKKYLRSWFLPDLVIVGADIMMLVQKESGVDGGMGSGSGVLRMSKASRFFRLLRLFRLARITDSFARLMAANVYLEIVIETMKPLLAIVIINHILACGWWSIGNYAPSDTGLNWVDEKVSGSRPEISYGDTGLAYQYLTCMHWSLTQLTPGSMQVAPLNSSERLFNCFGLLLGMLVFSSLISSISAKMMQHYLKQKDKLNKLAALRRFLGNKVAPGTVIAAQCMANKALFGHDGKPVTINEVAAIAMLPQALQRNIQVELCSKHLQHPLLRWWFVIDPKGAHGLCYHGIDFIGLAVEDHLFFPRASAIGAYVMQSGTATYILDSDARLDLADSEIRQGRFFCEAAWWCTWKHVGELTATAPCSLLVVRTSGMVKCLEEDVVVRHVIVEYGRSFYLRLTAPLLPEEEEPNDMSVPFTDFDSMLPSLPEACRQLVGAVAVKVNRGKQGWSEECDSIANEVREGTCCLMVNWEGEVERIVSIIVLRLSDQDGRVLVRLGVLKQDHIQATCELPGKKQMHGETPAQAFARFFQGAFAPFMHKMTWTGAELEETCKESKRMHVKTKYLRTVKHADLTCPVSSLGLEASQIFLQKRRRGADAPVAHVMSSEAVHDECIKIYALADDVGEITFVGWLNPKDLKYFSGPGGEATLQAMMDGVILKDEIPEIARARFAATQDAEWY